MALKDREDGTSAAGDGPKTNTETTAKEMPADEIFSAAIAAGISAYDRSRDLPRLLAVWPHEVENCTQCERIDLLEKLRRALRTQKRRADAGHWGYDLNRHLALFCAYKSELIALAETAAAPSCTGAKQAAQGSGSHGKM